MIILISLFALLMLAGTMCVVFKGGEKEGICKYGYMDEENED